METQQSMEGGTISFGATPMPTISKKLDPSLQSHFDLLYRPKRLFGKSPETIRLYGFTFGYFRAFLGREPTIHDLDDAKIMALMEWIVSKTNGLGLSLRTANKTRDQLTALWNFLARKSVVKTWPDVPSFPEPHRDPVGWTRDELKLLWQMCAAQRGLIAGVPADLWWLGIHSVAYDTLERIGAVRELRWSRVLYFDSHPDDDIWAHFPAETRKGGMEPNSARLHRDTVRILRQIRAASDDERVFPWNKAKEYLHTRYRILRQKAGLPTDRFHSFHCIRRTGASFAEAAGADASKLLRHSSRGVTERHYLVPSLTAAAQACDVLRRPDAPKDGSDDPRAA